MTTIPFFLQERPESCVPACLRMVLASYGLPFTEAELYHCCESDADGTLPSAVVRCVLRLGLMARTERLPDVATLTEQATQATPIVYLNLAPILGLAIIHAVIVEEIDVEQEQIIVIDPAYSPDGRRIWPLGLFQLGWKLARNQTILIAR